MFFFNII